MGGGKNLHELPPVSVGYCDTVIKITSEKSHPLQFHNTLPNKIKVEIALKTFNIKLFYNLKKHVKVQVDFKRSRIHYYY